MIIIKKIIYSLVPYSLKTRLSKNGVLRNQVKATKQLILEYPNDEYAKSVHSLFKQKYWLGAGKVNYNELYNDAWEKLNKKKVEGVFHIAGLKFITDSAFAFDFTGIFLADKIQPINLKLVGEEVIAAKVLALIGTTEGSYTHENVLLEKGDVVIDAGANMGLFSVFAANHGVDHIYAFEPQSYVVNLLNTNLEYNNLKSKVTIIDKGLGDKDEELTLNCDSNLHAAASIVLSTSGGQTEKIHCTSLDNWVNDNNITKVDFIKADIEGAERLMLKGAQRILAEFAPKLAICTYHLPDDREVLTTLILQGNSKYVIEYTSHKLFAYVPCN